MVGVGRFSPTFRPPGGRANHAALHSDERIETVKEVVSKEGFDPSRFLCDGFTVRRRTRRLGRLPAPASPTERMVGRGGMRASTDQSGDLQSLGLTRAQPTLMNSRFNPRFLPGRHRDAPDTVFGTAACSGVGRASAVPCFRTCLASRPVKPEMSKITPRISQSSGACTG